MKKTVILLALGLLMLSPSFANEKPVFDTYDNVEDIQQVDITPVKDKAAYKSAEIKEAVNETTYKMGQIQNDNYKQAIQSLDAAQVEIREELIQYNQQYKEARGRYEASKAECKELKRHITEVERKIKSIERTKANISKNIIEYF
jgi:chromosome segregation ATPase